MRRFLTEGGIEPFDAVTAISGSGPAYFFLLMEALEQAGIDLGLDAETARLLTIQTALGAARMAVEDFGGKVNGVAVEVVVADDQNKPDVGLNIARKWIESDKVDAIIGGSAPAICTAIGPGSPAWLARRVVLGVCHKSPRLLIISLTA